MPKTRQQKEEIFSKAEENAISAKSMVFVGYHGLSVPQLEDLRVNLRSQGVRFQVIKKTLLKRSLDKAGIDIDVKNLGDGLAVAYAMEDEVSAAKVLANFQKENESLKIYGGVLEQEFLDDKSIIELSKILSKPELYAKLVSTLISPVSGFANVLGGVPRGFVRVLNGIKESKP